MNFEELLESLYVGKIDTVTNNHMYMDLNKEALVTIREVLIENPNFSVINPTRNGMHYQENEYSELRNINVDFSKINIHDLLSYILFVLKIDLRIDFYSYQDLMLFIELVKRKGKGINLHLFNVNLLNEKEQKLLNSLMFLNLTSLCMQVYLEEGCLLQSRYDENDRELIEGEHFRVVSVDAPKFTIKLKNDYDKKAS